MDRICFLGSQRRDGGCWQVFDHLFAQRLGEVVSSRGDRPELPECTVFVGIVGLLLWELGYCYGRGSATPSRHSSEPHLL